MSYNEEFDQRISKVVAGWENIARKEMFGGIGYLLNGNIFCGVYHDYLIFRLTEEHAAEALKLHFFQEFDITGGPMKGWVMVEGTAVDEAELEKWTEKARLFVETLPKK